MTRVRTELEFTARVIVTGSEPLSADERAQLARMQALIREIGGPSVTLAAGSSPVRGLIRAALPAELVPAPPLALAPHVVLCSCGIEVDTSIRVGVPLHRKRCPFAYEPMPLDATLCGSQTRPHHSARRQEPLSCTRPRRHEQSEHPVLRACVDGRLVAMMSGHARPTWRFVAGEQGRD